MKHFINKLFDRILKWIGYIVLKKDDKVWENQKKIENGHGAYTRPNGDKYVGEFMDGLSHGQGTYTWKDGQKYVGEWKYGMLNGQGILKSPEYSLIWEGQWKNGKKHGKITITYLNKLVFEGEFKKGKRHGQGILYYRERSSGKLLRKYEGSFYDDKEWYGTWKDMEGEILETFVHGQE